MGVISVIDAKSLIEIYIHYIGILHVRPLVYQSLNLKICQRPPLKIQTWRNANKRSVASVGVFFHPTQACGAMFGTIVRLHLT